MDLLTRLPSEIIHDILSSCSPDDLVSLGLVSRWLRDFVRNNAALCRSIYCSYFVRPVFHAASHVPGQFKLSNNGYGQDEPPTKDLDWVREINDFIRLKAICASTNPKKKSELPFVYSTVKRLLGHSARIKPDSADTLFAHQTFQNAKILADLLGSPSNEPAFLCRSFIFQNGSARTRQLRLPDVPIDEYQMSAELHSLYGTMVRIYNDGTGESIKYYTYPHAASKVYDIRSYTRNTGWGPFMADGSGRVDWEKIEAILIVLRHNAASKGLLKFPITSEIWNRPFGGVWSESYMPIRRHLSVSPKESGSLDLKDPYNVSGTWMRMICFLDYRDFFNFNFPDEDNVPADMPRRLLNKEEETRLIIMKLQVTRIEPPGEDSHPDYPVVHFDGVSLSMDNPRDDNANSNLRGMCRMTKHGELHWTTFSVIDGQDRWRSESIQLGGVRSGRGVIGNWFDANYEARGPCGPTAFWKLHEKEAPVADGADMETLPYFLAGPTSIDFRITISVNQFHFVITNDSGDDGGIEDEIEDEDEDEDEDDEYQDDGEDEDEEDSD